MEEKCEGWGSDNCPNIPTMILISPGCPFCGGADCLDFGDAQFSCEVHAKPFREYALKNKNQIYEIEDLDNNIIWTNQLTNL